MSSPLPAILVAEDEALVRILTVEVLREAGFEVQEAADGIEALAILEKGGVDVLITDIQMPRMNGYQLAEAALARWPALKILLVTGYAREAAPGTLARANLHTLHKPFDVNRLPDVIARLIDPA